MLRCHKYIFAGVILTLLISKVSFSQADNPKVSSNDKALAFFIEGKTLELQNDFIGAIENFRMALKHDKAVGIYHALAEVYFKLSKFDEAKIEVNNALRIDPDNERCLETLAGVYIAEKDFKMAADTYEHIIRIDSNYTYGLYSLARIYQELKMPAKAIVIYEKITDKIGYDFDVLNKMYEIYINYKDYEKAEGVLEAILTLDPFNINVKKLLASLYMRNGKTSDARKLYEEIFTINPEDKDVQTELVKIYFKNNESSKAFENFSKMLGKDSLSYLEKVQVGELYYNLISQDESSKEVAENIFTNLSNEYPDRWIPYYYLGAIDLLNKKNSDAKDNFFRAIEFADTSREVYVNISFTFFQQRETDDAIKVADAGLAKFPDEFRLNYIKGLSLQQSGNEKDAIVYFEKAVDVNSADIGMLSTLALAYDNQGYYEKSSATYEKALKIDPQNALVLNNYAYNLSERGIDLDKALSMSKVAVDKDPQNASYLDTMGWIYYKMKNYKQAKRYIESSLAFNPNSAVVLEHLGDVYNAMKDNRNALKFWKLSLEKNPNNKSLKDKIDFL